MPKIELRRCPSYFLLLLITAITLTIFVSCATTLSPSAARIREADMKLVQRCKHVGDIHGTSGWGNIAASIGIRNAKNEALEMAATLGATHVVWTNVAGGYSPYVSGRAYVCR